MLLRITTANPLRQCLQDAKATAFKVGYESPSQFSREYRRFFGESPLKDIKILRETEQG